MLDRTVSLEVTVAGALVRVTVVGALVPVTVAGALEGTKVGAANGMVRRDRLCILPCGCFTGFTFDAP